MRALAGQEVAQATVQGHSSRCRFPVPKSYRHVRRQRNSSVTNHWRHGPVERHTGCKTVAAAPPRSDISTRNPALKPSSAETARTIVEIVVHGTLCTSGDDGMPLGTYSSYVLDEQGMPILRLRQNAVHTANLQRQPRCSLFVQPGDRPANLLARATLIGHVEPINEAEAASAAQRHHDLHPFGVGVDQPHDSDIYMRLRMDTCFYVGGMGANSQAEVIAAEEYSAAMPDPLREAASLLVDQHNEQRADDVLRIAAYANDVLLEQMEHAQLLWIDRLGLYVYSKLIRSGGTVIRVPFERPVSDERDAKSMLTMLAQTAWEAERLYNPVMPSVAAAATA